MEMNMIRPRIFIVCPRLCHGGAERVAVTLANGFVKKGYNVSFFSDLFEEQTYVLDNDVTLYNLVSVPIPKIRKWGSAIRILRKAIKKEKPDVIIGVMSLCSLIARIASLGMRVPVIATEHDSYERPYSAPMSKWEKLYKYHICKIFKRVTVLTEADKRVIGTRLKNVLVMPNPLAITPAETIPPKKIIILAAGRVDNWHYKGFDLLIRAYAKAISTFSENEVIEQSLLEHESEKDKGVKTVGKSLCSQQTSEWRLQIAFFELFFCSHSIRLQRYKFKPVD